MENSVIEANYPITFRSEDAKLLGEHLKLRHSVELIGMKRVGISNFLRFFLNHQDIASTYIGDGKTHVFIPVDLNDLVERELFPFWILTFKRLIDAVEQSKIDKKISQELSQLFLDAIQSRDLFLTVEGLRRALSVLVHSDITPTIFFLRFDRIKDVVTQEFFDNLQGLSDATSQKLSYVFTSFRSLDQLAPHVFPRHSLTVFSHPAFIKPANAKDMESIFNTFQKHYQINASKDLIKELIEDSGGHVQYLQLSILSLNQHGTSDKKDSLFKSLVEDERIYLQSEEIWESLTPEEQSLLRSTYQGEQNKNDENSKGNYLWQTGILNKEKIFSPLFKHYLSQILESTKTESLNDPVEFTKKEHMLFSFLKENLNQVCEREKIVDTVWPEYQEFGVSDWTIDRLVARLRTKLRKQNNEFSIITVKTRGYKLIEN